MTADLMRLRWIDHEGEHISETCQCLDDALNRAGQIYGENVGTIERLENWMGENVCPPEQLLPIAKMRHAQSEELAEHRAMEASPLWGSY